MTTQKIASRFLAIRIFVSVAAVATLMMVANGPAVSQPVSGEGTWSGSVSFDQLVQQYIAQNNLPGATVAVTKGSRLVLSKGYGFARLSSQLPMLPTHITYIGSTSKLITAVGAMKLIEEGKLDLQGLVYGTGTPLWGSAPGAPPGVLTGGTAVLKDPAEYFSAMVEGVNSLDPTFPPAESPSATLLSYTLYPGVMNRAFEWASKMRVKHLLSHTSGLLRSGTGATEEAEEQFGEATYKGVHLVVLKGKNGAPFQFEPGEKSKYSNHGFGLLGHIISERSGMEYEEFVRQRLLTPLGLYNVVRGGTTITRYAFPYEQEDHPFIEGAWTPKPMDFTVSNLGLATGGWAATAGDLVRFMCALDKNTTQPILKPATVEIMETIAYPAADDNQPLGWDWRVGGMLGKDGRTGAGGASQVIKFLPGEIGKDEINIAFATNINLKLGDIVDFLTKLAKIVAVENISEDYDLFDPQHACLRQVIAGTVTPRDNSPKAPACPRPADVAATIRTTAPGQVPYVLACTGDDRNWKGTATAHQTAPDTFIGVVVHPIQITKQEDVICFLRKGEQFGFSDVIATDKRHYPCKVTGVTTPTPLPPPQPPSGLKQPDPPAPPRLVCAGGKIARMSARSSCVCPRGQKAMQTGPNRFQCMRAARSTPELVCQGGRISGRGSAASCTCPPGQIARQTAPDRYRCAVQLVCEGGKVVNRGRPPQATCECPRGLVAQKVLPPSRMSPPVRAPGRSSAANDDQPDRYRCVRGATVPGKRQDKTSNPTRAPKVACAGGIVRSNRCVCPRGTALQNGVCRTTSRAPVRTR